jgi:SAM-dependent methyltransferase
MPDAVTLDAMYGPQYLNSFENQETGAAAVEPVLECLASRPPGTFLDFGCGNGELVRHMCRLGWDALGAEFDAQVARALSEKLQIRVVTINEVLLRAGEFDVVHMGDVIEHLTDAPNQFKAALRLLKPGGLLVAQGPLENNPNLFLACIKAVHRVRPKRHTSMPPYHVLLATADGQERFFRRLGLTPLTYKVTEAAWPAPRKLTFAGLTARGIVLWLLRKTSQMVTRLSSARLGNRYFYAGRFSGCTAGVGYESGRR